MSDSEMLEVARQREGRLLERLKDLEMDVENTRMELEALAEYIDRLDTVAG